MSHLSPTACPGQLEADKADLSMQVESLTSQLTARGESSALVSSLEKQLQKTSEAYELLLEESEHKAKTAKGVERLDEMLREASLKLDKATSRAELLEQELGRSQAAMKIVQERAEEAEAAHLAVLAVSRPVTCILLLCTNHIMDIQGRKLYTLGCII